MGLRRVAPPLPDGWKLNPALIASLTTPEVTVLAVNAPVMGRGNYTDENLTMLARKIALITDVSDQLGSPSIFTGLLGGGAFGGNRPLILFAVLAPPPTQ